MNNLLKKSFILTMVIAMVLTMFAAFGFAESTPSDSGELVVTGYNILAINSNTNIGKTPRISKGNSVKLEIMFRKAGLADLDFTRLVDSFSNGKISGVKDENGSTFKIEIDNLIYKGTGNSLKFMATYSGGQRNFEISVLECKEYQESTNEQSTPYEPDPIPAPKAIISRNELLSSIKPNEEITVTVFVKNIGSTTMQSPVIQFTPSDSLMLPGASSMMQLKNIAAGKTESVDIKVRAMGSISGANQYLDAVLNFDYELVTAVPQKWRKKYDQYLEEMKT